MKIETCPFDAQLVGKTLDTELLSFLAFGAEPTDDDRTPICPHDAEMLYWKWRMIAWGAESLYRKTGQSRYAEIAKAYYVRMEELRPRFLLKADGRTGGTP